MDQIEDSIVDERFGTNSDSENDYQSESKKNKKKEKSTDLRIKLVCRKKLLSKRNWKKILRKEENYNIGL